MTLSWEHIGFLMFQVEHSFSFQMFSLYDSYLYLYERVVFSVDNTKYQIILCFYPEDVSKDQTKEDVMSGNVSAAELLLSLVSVTYIKHWPS